MHTSLIATAIPEAVVCAEMFADSPESEMFSSEGVAVLNASAQRRREFGTVRHCARVAMGQLGVRPVAVLPDSDGAPRWPLGLVGSLTHCAGYRAAAVARSTDLRAIGIDAEPHAELPGSVHELVVRLDEQVRLRTLTETFPGVHWDRLLFCVKEAVYKAWFPSTRRWLDFTDVSTTLRPDGTFDAQIHVAQTRTGGTSLDCVTGRWVVGRGLVVAATAVARSEVWRSSVPGIRLGAQRELEPAA